MKPFYLPYLKLNSSLVIFSLVFQDVVERAVVKQLGVVDFQDLGCGQVQKLVSEYNALQETGGLPLGNCFSYLTPLLLNSRQSSASTTSLSLAGDIVGNTQHSVGVLGHKSRSDALRCLEAAPLLEDLGQWSHWSAVFQPQLGSLPEFLQGLGADSEEAGIAVLEVAPGKVLKIDRGSSVQAFNLAVSDLDHVGVAGHLVSLVALRGNTRDISPQLLSEHVTSVLQKVMAGEKVGDGADDEEGAGKEGVVAEFAWRCLQRIPLDLCKLLAREVSVFVCVLVCESTLCMYVCVCLGWLCVCSVHSRVR